MKTGIRKLTAFVLAFVLVLTCVPAGRAMAYDGGGAGAQGVQTVAEDTQSEADAQNPEELREDESGIPGDTDPGLIPAGEGTGLTLDGNGGKVNTGKKDKDGNPIYQDVYTLDEPKQYLFTYTPTNDELWFTGWYAEEGCSTRLSSDSLYYLNVMPAPGTTIYAGWEAPAQLNGHGGQVKGSDGKYSDTCYIGKDEYNLSKYDPKKDGNCFVGWYKEETLSTMLSFSETLPDTLKNPAESGSVLYAKWETALKLNGNGGQVKNSDGDYVDSCYNTRKDTNLSSYAPKKPGSSFTGWYSSADCKDGERLSSSYSISTLATYPEPGTEIYAGWQAAVKLDGNGGQVKGPDGEYYDCCYQEEYSYDLTGYRPVWKDHWFNGWYAEPECKTRLTADYNDSYLVNPPVPGTTLYAGWLTACKVDGNGGQVWDTESKSYVDSLFIQDDNKSSLQFDIYLPVRDNWYFNGWYADSDCTQKLNSKNLYTLDSAPQAGTTVYAGWTQELRTVTFKLGETAVYNGTLSKYTDVSEFEITVPSKVALSGDYAPPANNSSVYKFNDLHYVLKGWSETEGGELIQEIDEYIPAKDTVLYAIYSFEKHVLTFHAGDDGNGYYKENSQKKQVKQEVINYNYKQLSNKSRNSFIPFNSDAKKVFLDWYTDEDTKTRVTKYKNSSCTTEWDGSSDYYYIKLDKDSDLDLYAGWDASNKVLTLDPGDDAYFSDLYTDYEKKAARAFGVPSGGKIDERPYNPKHEDKHKKFTGWYSEKTGGELMAGVTVTSDYTQVSIESLTADTTWYAHWEDAFKVVTFDADGGSYRYYDSDLGEYVDNADMIPFSTDEDGKLEKKPNDDSVSASEDQVFEGWYDGNTKIENFSSHVFTKDTTLKAKYVKSYKVTFDAKGGNYRYYDSKQDKDVDDADMVSFRTGADRKLDNYPYDPDIDNDNLIFDAWYIGTTRIKSISDHEFTADTTVTAGYKPCHKVTLSYNGGYYRKYGDGHYVDQFEPYAKKVADGENVYSVETPRYEENAKTFGGWYLISDTEHKDNLSSNDSGSYVDYVPKGDVTLTVWWLDSCTVTFDAVTGYIPQPGTQDSRFQTFKAVEGTVFKSNKNAAVPEDPEIADPDYVFGSWCTDPARPDETEVSKDDILEMKITEDVTFYANYKPCWTVTFDPKEGSFVSEKPDHEGKYSVKIARGEPVCAKVPAVEHDDGHTALRGWFTDEDCTGEPVDLYEYEITKSQTIYAGWAPCYVLTFHSNHPGVTFANGTDTQAVKVVKGEPFRYGETSGKKKSDRDVIYGVPELVLPDGTYQLSGWYANADLSGDRYDFESSSHYVTHDGRRDYHHYMYGFVPTGDMDFYARCTEETVQVTFDANGKKFSETSTEYHYGKPYPSRKSDDRSKWIVTVPKGIEFGDIGTPTSFDDSTVNNESYSWAYEEKECKNSVYDSYIVEADKTVYCKWTKTGGGGGGGGGESLEVTLHAGEGYFYSDKKRKTVTESYTPGSGDWVSTDIPNIDDDVRSFALWYYDEALTKPYPAEYQLFYYDWGKYYYKVIFPERVDDLYAGYDRGYIVTLSANGGYFDNDFDRMKDPDVKMRETTGLRVKTYPGQSIIISDQTKRVRRDGNRIFGGWYLDRKCTEKAAVYALDGQAELFRPTENTTLYARWIDYEKPDSITASVVGKTELKIGESTELKAVISPAMQVTTAHWFISSNSPDNRNNPRNDYPARLDTDGKLIGIAAGTCTVYCMVNGVRSENVKVTVSADTVDSSITITDKDGKPFPDPVELFTGDGFVIKSVIKPAAAADNLAGAVIWKTTDAGIAQVTAAGDGRNANVIAGESEGTAVISATLGKNTVTVNVKVTNPVKFNKSKATVTAKTGAQVAVDATVLGNIADADISVGVYTSADGTELSDLATAVKGASTASGDRKVVPVTVTLTEKCMEIIDPRTVRVIVTVKLNGKDYRAVCALTINGQAATGKITANIPSGSVVPFGTKILLNCETAGTEIYYAFNEKLPVVDDSGKPGEGTFRYSDAIVIRETVTINAIAVRDRWKSSSAAFIYKVEDWGDAGSYREAFGNKLSNVPDDVWYGIGGKVYRGPGQTDFEVTYTGNKINFNDKAEVFAGTTKLMENRDYTLAFKNNVAAADADSAKAPALTIKGKGNYSNNVVFTFKIAKAPMAQAELVSDEVTTIPAGADLGSLKPKVEFNGKKLALKKDYVLRFYEGTLSDNRLISGTIAEAGKTYTALVTASETGNFNGDGEAFGVVAVDPGDPNTVQLGAAKVTDVNGKPLKLPYYDNAGESEKAYYDPDKSLNLEKVFDNGDGKSPLAYVVVNGNPLDYGKDFTVEAIGDCTNSGKRKLKVIGSGYKVGGRSVYGTKTVNYDITGLPINKVKVAGLYTSIGYTGGVVTLTDLFNPLDKAVTANGWKAVTLYTAVNGSSTVLVEGKDYTVDSTNYGTTGKFTLTFAGTGAYYGKLNKKINVKPYNLNDAKKDQKSKVEIQFLEGHPVFCKAGARPKVAVTVNGHILKEGVDFTVSYKNNTKVVTDYNALKTGARPAAVIKGRGNYSGSNANGFFNIKKADVVGSVTPVVPDVARNSKGKSGYFLPAPKLMDGGKAVSLGNNKDLDALEAGAVCYCYAEDTTLTDGTEKSAGETVSPDDSIPDGTMIEVRVNVSISGDKSPYYIDGGEKTAELKGYYRFVGTDMDIGKGTAKIKKGVTYSFNNGNEVIPVKTEDIELTLKVKGEKKTLSGDDFEIMSITDNRFLGTARVTLRGKGSYGGTKVFTFRIGSKNLK